MRWDLPTSSPFELLVQAGMGENVLVGSAQITEFCSFTKALEHLGDRWNLLIIRELGVFGPQGFNALAAGLPGRISRSVLTDRLRRLQDLGLVTRSRGQGPYRLTEAGAGLLPTIMTVREWAATWLPEDPAMVERDPDVLVNWLARRVDRHRLPTRQVVIELLVHDRTDRRYWLVLRDGEEPYGCLTDPLLDPADYVYVDGGLTPLLGLATGSRDWTQALGDGTVTASGDPALTRHLAEWFAPAGEA